MRFGCIAGVGLFTVAVAAVPVPFGLAGQLEYLLLTLLELVVEAAHSLVVRSYTLKKTYKSKFENRMIK